MCLLTSGFLSSQSCDSLDDQSRLQSQTLPQQQRFYVSHLHDHHMRVRLPFLPPGSKTSPRSNHLPQLRGNVRRRNRILHALPLPPSAPRKTHLVQPPQQPLKSTFKPGTLSSLKYDHSYEIGQYVNLSGNRSEKSVNTTPLHDDIELGQLQTSIQGDTMHGETPPEVMQGGILTRCEMRQWSEKR